MDQKVSSDMLADLRDRILDHYALMDYGAHLKQQVPNPSRRSRHHTRQSAFEGSRRQKRARLLRAVLAAPGIDVESLVADQEWDTDTVRGILTDMADEGMLQERDGRWFVSE